MKKSPIGILPTRVLAAVGVFLAVAAGCAETGPTAPSSGLSLSKAQSVTLCHSTGAGDFNSLTVNGNAVAGHLGHGDALPGDDVPGMENHEFDSDCAPVEVVLGLTGVWEGSYSWDCQASGDGLDVGSSTLRLEIVDHGDGWITGTATYLGGTVTLQSGERLSDPYYRSNGTMLGGTFDPDGTYIRLRNNADSDGHFTNNEFIGLISADFTTITGNTLNGDTSYPWAPGRGCGAYDGYAGSFEVVRVG